MGSFWDWFDTLAYHLSNQQAVDTKAADADSYEYPDRGVVDKSKPIYNDRNMNGDGMVGGQRFSEGEKRFNPENPDYTIGNWEIPNRAFNGLEGMSQDRMPNVYPRNPSLKDWR